MAEYESGGEAGRLDKLREFRDALATTLRRMRQPQVFLPGVLLMMLPDVVLEVSRVADWRRWKATVERDAGRWGDVWRGLGTYYGRVIGTYALIGLAAVLLILASFGSLARSLAEGTMPPAQRLPLQGLFLVGQYFFAPWMAAAVLEGTGVFKSIGRGAAFAWRNPLLLGPAFALQAVCDYLLGSWSLAPDLIIGAAQGFLFMFFLVLYFDLYRRRIATAPPPTTLLEAGMVETKS